jgi:hypothetical protein
MHWSLHGNAAWLLALACLIGCADGTQTEGTEPPYDASIGQDGAAGERGADADAEAEPGDAAAADSAGADAEPEDGGAADAVTDAVTDAGEPCVYDGPELIDPSEYPSCESDTCSDAHCVGAGVLTDEQAARLADCADGSKCVPDLLLRTLGNFLLDSCTSLLGAEGRCVSTCVPVVQRQIESLPQDVCVDGELCAPCYDPITREATGACTQSCDQGPTAEPVYFDECCGGLSVCVPEALVPEDQAAQLDAAGCDGGELCAPKAIAARDYQPVTCSGPGGGEARCLPACLPSVAARAGRLARASCGEGELCVPCFDPLSG